MKSTTSLQEHARLTLESLSKMRSVTLEEMRAQVLWKHSRTPTGVNELVVKDYLKMYYPVWTQEQIEEGCAEIKLVISKESKWQNIIQALADYLGSKK